MRILHFADLHLGVETYGRIDPSTGLSSRLTDFLESLDELVDYALNNHIDLVLFCGDAYKNRDPGQTYQREFARRIKRLSTNNIPVFLVAGNHDLPNAVGRATAVEIFDTLAIQKITVVNEAHRYSIETKSGMVQIVALPWGRRSKLLSREDKKNLTSGQINQRMEEVLTNWINSESENLDECFPAIMAAHLSHSKAVIGSERTMLIGHDYVIPIGALNNPAFDYVALGHIHNRQEVDNGVPVVYSGSLQTIDFGDEGQDKGFYVIEIDEKVTRGCRLKSYEFHPVKTRRFLTITVDANTDDPMNAVLNAIKREDIEGAIVRIYIKVCAEKAGLIDENEIRKILKDAYFIAAMHKEVEREHRTRLGTSSVEALTPLAALELYFKSNKINNDRTRVLLRYGEKLLQEISSKD